MSTYMEKIKERVYGKQICIYPMGIAGKSMLDKLSNIGIEINYFCD